jgi:hypothetical protein
MRFEELHLSGLPCLAFDAGDVRVAATTSVGPRILGLLVDGGRNLLAELPGMTLDCPGSGPFHLYGGHRLWAAPEDPATTYRPDDDPLTVTELPDGVELTGPTDTLTGLRRTMAIRVTGAGRLAIDHIIRNDGASTTTLAPWAITQLPVGGRAWLPLADRPIDPGAFLAERNVVLWPYTRLDDPRFSLRERVIEVRTDGSRDRTPGKVKAGTGLRRGFVAYHRDGYLFLKRARHQEDARYVDLDASAQVFANGDFTETETLGPLVDLGPGQATTHREDWEVRLMSERDAEDALGAGALDG